ncbi:MAG: Panacea domain-containing protein [Caldilineaceae bacterium]|nr:Panacea domain-containing protein [Caldilineaceae bacterium]
MLTEKRSTGRARRQDIEEAVLESEDLQIRVEEERLDVFRQVILHVLDRVEGKPNVGEAVLHQLFYFIDFDYYEKFEENLMGETYIKNGYGPTSVNLTRILRCMEEEGAIRNTEQVYHNYSQNRFLTAKRSDTDLLRARDIEHIDQVLARFSGMSVAELSEYTHNDIPWKCARFGEPIPYETVFYRDDRYSVSESDDAL